jgi:hypothetical protein
VLLGDGRQLLCSGGVFFGVRSGAQWGGLFFGVRSEDPLVGKSGVFFGVRSGAVAWQRHLHNLKRFHLGSVLVQLLGSGTTMGWYFLWGPFSVFFGVCSMCGYKAGQQLRVSKFCESEMATKDTQRRVFPLVLNKWKKIIFQKRSELRSMTEMEHLQT